VKDIRRKIRESHTYDVWARLTSSRANAALTPSLSRTRMNHLETEQADGLPRKLRSIRDRILRSVWRGSYLRALSGVHWHSSSMTSLAPGNRVLWEHGYCHRANSVLCRQAARFPWPTGAVVAVGAIPHVAVVAGRRLVRVPFFCFR